MPNRPVQVEFLAIISKEKHAWAAKHGFRDFTAYFRLGCHRRGPIEVRVEHTRVHTRMRVVTLHGNHSAFRAFFVFLSNDSGIYERKTSLLMAIKKIIRFEAVPPAGSIFVTDFFFLRTL